MTGNMAPVKGAELAFPLSDPVLRWPESLPLLVVGALRGISDRRIKERESEPQYWYQLPFPVSPGGSVVKSKPAPHGRPG